jgi:hypothetical protein
MTPKQLLQECEKLTNNGRMRRMVELGRQAASDSSIEATFIALAQGDMYQRILATQACYGSRNSAQVLRALSDPSRRVRSLALRQVGIICRDDEVLTALNMLPLDMRTALSRRLHKRHRYAPLDRYLETLDSYKQEELKKLLPFGSRTTVARYLGSLGEQLDVVTLSRLVRRYPDLVVEQLRIQASARDTIDPRFIGQINELLPLLADSAPDLALDLVRTLLAVVPLARLSVQSLVSKHPNEIADLLFQANEESALRFDGVAHRLDTERLLTLFTRFPGTISTRCFEKLRSEQRFAIYSACARGWRNAEGILPYHIVAALPAAADRLHEGRRHLELPALTARLQERFRYAAFLPWDEARSLLDTPLRSPDADLRGVALQTLIDATRYQREHVADTLQLVRQRRNEQDPVRCKMLIALAGLPHGIWQVEHLDNLAQIIRDALNATDLSLATGQAVERLVVYLFPFHPEWAASQIAYVFRERGRIGFFQLEAYLSDADIRRIAPLLTPILRSWQRREYEGLLMALAIALGKRLRVFDELADLLEATLHHTLNGGIVHGILRLFLKHRRERVARLIPRLLQHDKSIITLDAVYNYLHRHRQDLITPFLGQHAYKGRFSTGRTRFVLPLRDGFYRWTPAQQETFAHTLLEIVRQQDQHRAVYELLSTIERLAVMPAIDPTPLIQLARDERQPVREAALRALGRLDAGQGVPELLEALNDERARIAIYALRRALLSMPQEETLALLRAVPLTQVTVAKEVVRLIGDLSSEAAYRELLALEARELHRDVRVALLRALWPYAEREETWEVFTRAAQAPDTALARGVVHIPEDGLSPDAQRRLVQLSATLLAHPEPEVRMATLQWRSQYPLTDNEQILFTRVLTLMHSQISDERALAAQTIFSLYTGNNAELVGRAIRELLSNRKALQTTLENFVFSLSISRKRLLPTTRAILTALAGDPLTLSWRVELIIRGLPWEEIAPELMKLADRLHANALVRAQFALEQAHRRPDAHLFDLEMALANSENEGLRRLALAALIAQSRQSSGWSDECIARLQVYRNDPSPLVAEAAQFTFVS